MIEVVELKIGEINEYPGKLNLCLGYFDGIHIGHLALINEALKSDGDVAILTFDLPPKAVLSGHVKGCSLTSLYDKSLVLDSLGVKKIFYLVFDEELAKISKEDFIEQVLLKLKPSKLFIGDDYSFGHLALGHADDLKPYFTTFVMPVIEQEGHKVSSSTIVDLIKEGEVTLAKELLGRYYQITGIVIAGNQIGRTIGFPTANLSLGYPYVLPLEGVYLGRIDIYGEKYFGIVSVSTHPSIMELKEPIIEVNIDHYDGDLYGKEISVEFLEFVNVIQKFNSLEELQAKLNEYKNYLRENLSKYC